MLDFIFCTRVGHAKSYSLVMSECECVMTKGFARYNKLEPTFLCVRFLSEISWVFKHPEHPPPRPSYVADIAGRLFDGGWAA